MGLGRWPETTLAMARDRALEVRREMDATRRDPIAERRRTKGMPFKAAAEAGRGRVARPFGFALTDPGRRLSRTRLLPEVTRIGPLLASRGE